mmetsp:Transcript_4124/g.5722  ORF Transcript_4124/g.5722 Transcript_4124/m.5722 type:complete len:106 (+) Transcript_4124:106-423(+)
MRGLTRLLKERAVIILAAKPALMPMKSPIEHKEFMPPSWQRMVTCRLTLLKEEQHSGSYATQMSSCTMVHVKSISNLNESGADQSDQHRQMAAFIINDAGISDLK